MFKGKDNQFTYKVEKRGEVSIESRQYILSNYIDEMVAFYESKIQFQQRSE
jgi:hypothetical protein